MRIAFVTLSAPWAGNRLQNPTNRHLPDALNRIGSPTRVVTPFFSAPRWMESLSKKARAHNARPARYEYEGVEFASFPGRFPHPNLLQHRVAPIAPALASGLITRSVERRTAELCREHGAEAILLHNGILLGDLGRRLSSTLGVPFGILERDAVDLAPTSRLGRSYARTLRDAATIITVGPRWLPFLREGLGLEQAVAIPNGVHPPAAHQWDRARPPEWRDRRVVLCVGNYGERKGQALLMRAFARAKIEDGLLALVGRAPAPIVTLADELGIGDRVEFLDPMPQDELMQRYVWADLFALPSWWEGFGNVYAEAMAAETPIILTSDSGMAAYVTHGAEGWVLPPKDEEAIEAALLEAFGGGADLAEMGRAGRRLVEREFKWERIAEKVEAALGSRAGAAV